MWTAGVPSPYLSNGDEVAFMDAPPLKLECTGDAARVNHSDGHLYHSTFDTAQERPTAPLPHCLCPLPLPTATGTIAQRHRCQLLLLRLLLSTDGWPSES